MKNKPEIQNWLDTVKRDLNALTEAVHAEATDYDMLFGAANDLEFSMGKLYEEIDKIEVPEAGPPYDAATATGMYDHD